MLGLCWTHLDTDALHSFILLPVLFIRSLMKTIKLAELALYETLFRIFTSPLAILSHPSWILLDLSRARSVLSISYRISVSHCHSLQSILATQGARMLGSHTSHNTLLQPSRGQENLVARPGFLTPFRPLTNPG